MAEAFPGGRAIIEQGFRRKGHTESAIRIMVSSISSGTLKQYSSSLKLWWTFCRSNNIDLYTFSIDCLLKFFTQLFESGAAYGTLNCARSALALIISPEVGVNLEIKRYFKGLYNLRPSKPKYNVTWDPTVVLHHLRGFYPLESLSMERLTLKLVTLLALITAHRIQTLSLIELQNIHKNETGFQIWIKNRIKTTGRDKVQPVLQVPYFAQDPRICAAKTLEIYLEKTENLRRGNTQLILTFKKPHNPATTQTISRWIKSILLASGVDTTLFSAHSTRHSSTSFASKKGISIDTIKNTAGWTSQSSTFARFYNRPIVNTNEFALSILGHTESRTETGK